MESCFTYQPTSWTRDAPAEVIARALERYGAIDVLLASPRSASTTGTEFLVDSGWLEAS